MRDSVTAGWRQGSSMSVSPAPAPVHPHTIPHARFVMSPSTQPTTPLLAGRNLVQVALTTRDQELSKAFYRDVLGVQLLFEVPNMVFYQMGNLRLMVGVESSLSPGGSVLYIDAPDIDSLGTQLESRGVRFGGPVSVLQRTDKGELKLREFKDPDGNSLALMGLVPKA
jgi:catechol 2,3-dioxygenase-like lactoylglutathione lyase family enzyme